MDTYEVKVEFTLDEECSKVWDYLFNYTHKWWPKEAMSSKDTKMFVLNERIGGYLYEDFGDGEGLIWAEVIGVKKYSMLLLKGHIAPDFGGPAISYLKITLEPKENSCLFKLSDYLLGSNTEPMGKSISEGWSMIFKDHFCNYVTSMKHSGKNFN
jgi:hypothetical protein